MDQILHCRDSYLKKMCTKAFHISAEFEHNFFPRTIITVLSKIGLDKKNMFGHNNSLQGTGYLYEMKLNWNGQKCDLSFSQWTVR